MSFNLIADAGAWFWDKYGKDIADKAFGTAKEKWERFKWESAAQMYRERVSVLHSTTRILGNPRPINLEDIYTDVFILDKVSALRRYDIELLRKAPRQEFENFDRDRKHALRIIPENDRLLILGKPGSGKTTFLKHIILLAIDGKIREIPIFVPCKEWADSRLSLMTFIAKQFEICAFPDAEIFILHILEKGEAIVLFDGLDEVNEEDFQRSKIINSLNEFANSYPKDKCLITCRVAATDYEFEKFTYVEIADFSQNQIQMFVNKWFKDNDIKRKTFLDELMKPEQAGLRELAKIPLLLTLLCLAFDESMSFPQRKVEVYEEALDALLRKWDAARNIKRDTIYQFLSLGRKRQMLARIAAESFEKGEYFLRKEDLIDRITNYLAKLPSSVENMELDSEAVLKAIVAQHGIIVELAQKIYAFSHSTLQEYFVSRYIADNALDGTLERLVHTHLTDKRWHEVFLLTSSILDNADSFFESFRIAVNKLIQNDVKLVKILRWASEKAAKDYANLGEPAFIRAIALDIDIDRERSFVSARAIARASSAIQTRDLTRTLALASARTGSLAGSIPPPSHDLSRTPSAAVVNERDMSEERAHALALSNACSLIVALARDLAFALNNDISGVIDHNRLINLLHSAYRYCLKASQELNLISLYYALMNLPGITEESTLENLQTFVRVLRSITIDHRNIGFEWGLLAEQVEQLKLFNEANILLMECLKVAYVTERSTIENSLLLLPENQ